VKITVCIYNTLGCLDPMFIRCTMAPINVIFAFDLIYYVNPFIPLSRPIYKTGSRPCLYPTCDFSISNSL